MSRLFTFGDSFPAGLNKPSEKDYIFVKPFGEYIAEDLGLEFENRGRTGNNNPAIAAEVMSTEFNDSDLILVIWSGLLRPRCWDGEKYACCTAQNLPYINLSDPIPGFPERVNEAEALLMTEYSIRACINYLRDKKVRFKMIGGFVHPSFINFETTPEWIGKGRTLMDVCQNTWEEVPDTHRVNTQHQDYALTPLLEICMHPNAEGHKEIAKVLKLYLE